MVKKSRDRRERNRRVQEGRRDRPAQEESQPGQEDDLGAVLRKSIADDVADVLTELQHPPSAELLEAIRAIVQVTHIRMFSLMNNMVSHLHGHEYPMLTNRTYYFPDDRRHFAIGPTGVVSLLPRRPYGLRFTGGFGFEFFYDPQSKDPRAREYVKLDQMQDGAGRFIFGQQSFEKHINYGVTIEVPGGRSFDVVAQFGCRTLPADGPVLQVTYAFFWRFADAKAASDAGLESASEIAAEGPEAESAVEESSATNADPEPH